MLGLFNLIHKSAELFSQLENSNIAYNTELCDSDHYILLLSNYFGHIETDNKMLSLFLKHLIYFIKKVPS